MHLNGFSVSLNAIEMFIHIHRSRNCYIVRCMWYALVCYEASQKCAPMMFSLIYELHDRIYLSVSHMHMQTLVSIVQLTISYGYFNYTLRPILDAKNIRIYINLILFIYSQARNYQFIGAAQFEIIFFLSFCFFFQ